MRVLTDAQWEHILRLVEAVCPHGKAEHLDLRLTL